jgi:hypothetical protein
MVEKIILWNVEVINIDSYVCYKVRKLSLRNKIFQDKKYSLCPKLNDLFDH